TAGWDGPSSSPNGVSKKRRNSSGTFDSPRGARLPPDTGRRALARASMLTTAGNTFLTTSRYEDGSLGATATAAPAGSPRSHDSATRVPANKLAATTTAANDHLFI